MKLILSIAILFFSLVFFSQGASSVKAKPGRVSFITTLDIANATKDGVYVEGYVVNISYEKLKELNGKKVRITGKVKVIKGIGNDPGLEERQGRANDYGYIRSPKIKIVD